MSHLTFGVQDQQPSFSGRIKPATCNSRELLSLCRIAILAINQQQQTRLGITEPGSHLTHAFTSMCFTLTSSAFGTEIFKTPSVNLASIPSSFTSEGSGKTRRNSP